MKDIKETTFRRTGNKLAAGIMVLSFTVTTLFMSMMMMGCSISFCHDEECPSCHEEVDDESDHSVLYAENKDELCGNVEHYICSGEHGKCEDCGEFLCQHTKPCLESGQNLSGQEEAQTPEENAAEEQSPEEDAAETENPLDDEQTPENEKNKPDTGNTTTDKPSAQPDPSPQPEPEVKKTVTVTVTKHNDQCEVTVVPPAAPEEEYAPEETDVTITTWVPDEEGEYTKQELAVDAVTFDVVVDESVDVETVGHIITQILKGEASVFDLMAQDTWSNIDGYTITVDDDGNYCGSTATFTPAQEAGYLVITVTKEEINQNEDITGTLDSVFFEDPEGENTVKREKGEHTRPVETVEPAGESSLMNLLPAEDIPIEIPIGEPSTNETPAEEMPSVEVPNGETPAGETPSGETPAEETPSGETPSGEVPANAPSAAEDTSPDVA